MDGSEKPARTDSNPAAGSRREPGGRPPAAAALRLKRLIHRSRYTGTLETDALLGAFAERVLPTLAPEQLDAYERLLEAGEPDLYMWISGRRPVPDEWNSDVMNLLMDFRIVP